MKNRPGDINDDEIRIITSGGDTSEAGKGRIMRIAMWIVAALLLVGISGIIFFAWGEKEGENEKEATQAAHEILSAPTAIPAAPASSGEAYTVCRDTVADGIGLTILTPVNATAVLEIGHEALSDSTAVLIAQAADIRQDNGGIVGSFVANGELMSKGEAKAGFCAIINREITIGVADTTPLFEQAITENGYFFRQYPLVVGGQIVENKLKGTSLRRALVEINGKTSVVASKDKLTLHDFSEALADIGAVNAIYLVGGDAFMSYRNAEGQKIAFGKRWEDEVENVNYIVWR